MSRRIVVGAEPIVSVFMNNVMGTVDAFQSGRAVGVVDVDDDTREVNLIAGIWFEDYNGANMVIHVAALEGVPWISKKLLGFVFHYAFTECGVRRLTGIVSESNHKARKFDEHLGFKYETRLKDAAPDGDLLIYVMRKEDCRWLKLRGGLPPLSELH